MDLTITPSAVFEQGFGHLWPYLIAIALVMGTAYWQQRQTMARSQQDGQPKQPGQGLLKIFPVFFGFISFQMPSGLVVYFAASQIFRIGQQALILRLDDRPKVAATEAESKRPAPDSGPKKATPAKPKAKPEAKKAEEAPKGRPAPRRPQGSNKKRGKRRRRK
jgi:YidC/Oxa1 family membrane protein insertase